MTSKDPSIHCDMKTYRGFVLHLPRREELLHSRNALDDCMKGGCQKSRSRLNSLSPKLLETG